MLRIIPGLSDYPSLRGQPDRIGLSRLSQIHFDPWVLMFIEDALIRAGKKWAAKSSHRSGQHIRFAGRIPENSLSAEGAEMKGNIVATF